MNEEEKQAIEELKNFKSDKDCKFWIGLNGEKAIDIIINLIERQQDEIEELKHDNSILCEIAYTGKRIPMPYTMIYTGTDNFISKDKIKEKIEELKTRTIGASTGIYAAQVDILEEILNEE